MSRKLLSAALAALLAASPALALTPPSERVFNLDDSITLALANSAEVNASLQAVTIADERVKEAFYLFLPELGVSASVTRYSVDNVFAVPPELGGVVLSPGKLNLVGHQDLFSGRLYFSQTLYQGGRVINTYNLAKAALQQAKSEYEAARMDARSQTQKVFFELLYAQKRAAAVQSAADEAPPAAELEPAPALERIEAAGRLERLRRLSAESRRELEAKRLAYLKGLNLELNTPVKLAGAPEPKTYDVDLGKAVVWAMELRPELKSEVYKAQVDAIGVNLALGRRLPTVLLGGTYEITDQNFPLAKHDWFTTLAVRFPFSYNFWSQLVEKKAEQRTGTLRRASLQDQVRLEVTSAHEDLQFWQKELPQRQKAFESLRDLYRQAAPSGLKLLGPRLALLDAELQYLEALSQSQLSAARLERAVGRDLE